MEKKAIKNPRFNNLIDIKGTRYHQVVLMQDKKIVLMLVLSTPLTPDEVKSFVEARIGREYQTGYELIVSETTKAHVDACGFKVSGLATFEAMIAPLIPEVVIDEKVVKYTLTNKGVKAECVTNNEEEE